MVNYRTNKSWTWIDLDNPTTDEIRELGEKYNLPAPIIEDLTYPTPQPRTESYEGFIYSVFHFPAFKHSHKIDSNQEIDLIVGREMVITAHYDTIDTLERLTKEFEVAAILDKSNGSATNTALVLYLLKNFYAGLTDELAYIKDWLKEIEKNMFLGKERDMVYAISNVSKVLLNFRQTLEPHGETVATLTSELEKMFGPEESSPLASLNNNYKKIIHSIHNLAAHLAELRETNNSLVSTKQNEIMKVLTIMAFVTFPLSLIASIFGMNTSFIPLVGHPYDFWIVIGIMGVATLCFFVYFKYRDWL